MARHVHVVGAGLAGLAAALALSRRGHAVTVHEAAVQAGGRCRSHFDRTLGCRIDNGNHLLLSGNRAALAYLRETGAADSLVGPPDAAFRFRDLADGRSWTVRPNRGRLGWWILVPGRRVPETGPLDYLAALRLLTARPDATVMAVLGPGAMMERFWRPLTVAALNAEPEVASAGLLRSLLLETFGRGGQACRPLVARDGLGPSFVDPALATLARRGVAIGYGRRLRALSRDGRRVAALDFGDGGTIGLGPQDGVVLAVPAPAAADLLPDLTVPRGSSAIVNAHFRLAAPARLPGGASLIGLVNGTAQWLFVRDDVVSVTVSAADALAQRLQDDLLAALWRDVARTLGTPDAPQPVGRIVKERRATFLQTPSEVARRPGTATNWRNLALAGDWVDTGLPATIEGAIRSGNAAAELLGKR